MGQCACGSNKPSIKISIASTKDTKCIVESIGICYSTPYRKKSESGKVFSEHDFLQSPQDYSNSNYLRVNKIGIPILSHPSINPLFIKRFRIKNH